MADEEDLVSKVVVNGIDTANRQFTTFADTGAAAFDKVDKAAKKAGDDIEKASRKIEKGADSAKRGLNDLARTNLTSLSRVAPDLKQIELGAKNLVTVVRSGIPAIASFVTRLTAAGTAAVAAGVGILKLASNVAKAAQTQETALDKQTKAQIESNDSSLAAQTSAINLESTQRKLFQQLQSGQITYSEYSKALRQTNLDYKEQQRVAIETENAQRRVRLENERLTKQAADTKAFQAQVDMFGGPLLSSLIQLGNTASQLFARFRETFGPAIAQGIDLITNTLNTNGNAIATFFSEASSKIAAFISKNGPAINRAFNSIGAAIKIVFEGVLEALPGLLAFFNDSLVPAVQGFGAVLNTVASVINTIFGTQLTGGAIVFLVILGQMTGAFVALINVIRIFAALMSIVIGLPFGPAILAIVAVLGVLLFIFPQLRQVASDVFNSILATFQAVAAGAQASGAAIVAAFRGVITFFTTFFSTIAGLFAAGWNGIVVGVVATVELIKVTFNALVTFISEIISSIGQAFRELGTAIVDAFTSAFTTLKNAFLDLLNFAKAQLQPIIDMLKAIISLGASASGNADGGPVSAAGGGHIRGPGTATSDSIPAWLSDGEFVIKAKSVAKYGASLLHAINSGRFRMPKFNMGGLASNMINPTPRFAYADGGEVAGSKSMRPMTLNLFGQEFKGLMVPEDVGQSLTKYAVARQNKSAGRKPAWVGRGRNNGA